MHFEIFISTVQGEKQVLAVPFQPCHFLVNHCCVSEVIKLCAILFLLHPVENEKVAGSCKSELLKEELPAEEEDSGNTAADEDNACDLSREDEAVDAEQEGATASHDLEKDAATAAESNQPESQAKDEQPGSQEEDMDAQTETESTQPSAAVETGSNDNEATVDTDTGSKAETEKESVKTEETAAEATKGSSSVEGDEQKKRFVVLCLLEQTKKSLCLLHRFLLLNRFLFSLLFLVFLGDVSWSAHFRLKSPHFCCHTPLMSFAHTPLP